MQFPLAQIQEAIGAQFIEFGLDAEAPATCVRGWSIDSRTVDRGDLFFAIRGQHFDGHAFVNAAFERGAVAAVVSEDLGGAEGPRFKVPDTLAALQGLASWARSRWHKTVVAVTGSAGKTSTKDIIAELLSVRLRVGKTGGNLNNHLGLPLSLLRVPEDAEVAVLEMGMNHAGEIRQLAGIARPQIGVVTNVGYAHIEYFDSIEGIAAGKRELIEQLAASDTAILNADDERVVRFREAHPGRTITYGFSRIADVRAEALKMDAEGAAFTVCGVRFETRLTGRHAISNILAGLAVASCFEIAFRDMVEKVAELAPGKMRGERHQWRGAVILNDAYNSNPEAVRSMIEVLKQERAERRIAVLGEMLELGSMAEALHRDLGSYAANSGVDLLLGVRGVSRLMVEQARQAGLDDHTALFFEDPESAGSFLRDIVRPGDAILFKGSRGTHVERALATMEA